MLILRGGNLYASRLCGCKFFKNHFENNVLIGLTRLFKNVGGSSDRYALLSDYVGGNINFQGMVSDGFIEDYTMP